MRAPSFWDASLSEPFAETDDLDLSKPFVRHVRFAGGGERDCCKNSFN